MTFSDLLAAGLVLILVIFVLYRLAGRYAPWVLGSQFPEQIAREEREKVLAQRVEDLERKNKYQEEDLNRKIKDLELTVKVLTQQGDVANEKIQQMKMEIASLERQVAELKRYAPPAVQAAVTKSSVRRVLGVWPTAPQFDLIGEKDALYASGFDYEALEGENATRMGIVLELDRNHYDIMEIGAQGGPGGIKLTDGITPPGWWLQLARQHNIDIFVVLANQSSAPGTINVADALYSAGAKAVISVDSTIADTDAVRFARVLYSRLSQNIALAKAVDVAKLVISDLGSEAIRLRER